jgi:hypothetical protein
MKARKRNLSSCSMSEYKQHVCNQLKSYMQNNKIEFSTLKTEIPKKKQILSIPSTPEYRTELEECHQLLKQLSLSPLNNLRHPDKKYPWGALGNNKNYNTKYNLAADPYSAFEQYLKYKEMNFLLKDLSETDKVKISQILTKKAKFLREQPKIKKKVKSKYQIYKQYVYNEKSVESCI